MSELTQITEIQQVSLNILRLLGNDPASAKKALAFIGDSRLNLEIFRDSYISNQPQDELPSSISAAVDVAIEVSNQKLSVFQ